MVTTCTHSTTIIPDHRPHPLTDEVIRIEEVIVPYLHGEYGREVALRLGQAVEMLLLLNHHDILSRQVLHREHKSPVEVALSIH